MLKQFRRLASDNRAATAVEYGLIAALISVVLITALSTLGGSIKDTFTKINTAISSAH